MSTVEQAIGGTHEPCTVTLFRTSAEDALLSRRVFDTLVAAHYLEIDGTGRYRKAHGGY